MWSNYLKHKCEPPQFKCSLCPFAAFKAFILHAHQAEQHFKRTSPNTFPCVLRMWETVQITDGSESTRTRGVWEEHVLLSDLPLRHADEDDHVESFEEGAWLFLFDDELSL
ncbi:hypothetical protein KPH14_002499 [Odynerus spinipes]|uniref:Uncharacterized protein n=1 Tax=Odynerus spinipes TaxID=1348599 RepID=A0AAD9RT39_9HYME|nr:hypothetical protein KPH14_002499 [Odynerus spinipes]